MPPQPQAKPSPSKSTPKEAPLRPTTNDQRSSFNSTAMSGPSTAAPQPAPSNPVWLPSTPACEAQRQPATEQAPVTQQPLARHACSAFQRLLIMFGRLCAEDYPESREMPEDFVLPKEWEQCLPQPVTPAAGRFLMSLPHVRDPKTIPSGEQQGCMICSLPFFPLATPTPGPYHHPNVARALPCEHYFCCGCIGKYIKPPQATPRDRCPLCGSVLFVDWLRFGYFTTLPGQVKIIGWADRDHAEKIQLFQNWVAPVKQEYNVAIHRWEANPLSHSASSDHSTNATHGSSINAAPSPSSSAQTTPKLVLHLRARKELHLRVKMLHFMRSWIQWREDPTELQPDLSPVLIADLFTLRREQEWDPTGLHEANAGARVA